MRSWSRMFRASCLWGPRRRPAIEYQPRPELVRPSSATVLPTPQDGASRAASWPESPEQRLARIRREAGTEEGITTPIIRDGTGRQQISSNASDVSPTASQREEFRRRLAEQRQGSPNARRTLSEPPTEYRRPADTAPQGELGDPEWRKEREARRAAGGKSGLRDLLPW